MIAVIFEVYPDESRKQEYLDIATELKPMLEEIDGFISIERFSSLVEEGKILSLSFWRDEQAISPQINESSFIKKYRSTAVFHHSRHGL